MSGFEPFHLKWGERTYTVRPHRVMGALQHYERAITPQDFQLLATGGMAAVPSVCAAAYGALLRYAGAQVSDEDVFLVCRDEGFAGDQSAEVLDRLLDLQFLRLPPKDRERLKAQVDAMDPDEEGEAVVERAKAEPESENPTSSAPASSKARSKRRSAADG